MPRFVVDHRHLGDAIERGHREAIEKVVAAIRKTVKLHGPRIAQALVDREEPKPVDRGTYRRSFEAADIKNGAEFFNHAPHAPIIEGGRRKGSKMPPVDLIAAWVKRKGLGRVRIGPIQKGGRRRPNAEQIRTIAFLVARSIAKHGLPAHRILGRTTLQLTPIVQAEVDRALQRIRGDE